MPAMLTHDLFGQDAFGPALGAIDLYTPDERDAFLLGNQGPDPLFYLALLPPLEEFERLGTTMHHIPPSAPFVSLRKAADGLPEVDQPIALAYLAGFTCHYLLDRAVHPFVYFWERGICAAGVDDLDESDASIVHAEIERDLDEMVLFVKRDQTIETYRPYEQVLCARDDVLRVIGDLYCSSVVGSLAEDEPTASRVFPLAVKSFRVTQRMFWSPTGKLSDALAFAEKPLLNNRYSLVRAMSHRVRAQSTSDFDNRDHATWRNPFTGESSRDSFWDIYDRTLGEVVPALKVVLGEDFDEEAAYQLTGGLNFCGERVE